MYQKSTKTKHVFDTYLEVVHTIKKENAHLGQMQTGHWGQ